MLKSIMKTLVLGRLGHTNDPPCSACRAKRGDLLAAEAGKTPTQLAVDANSDFGFDLYRQLAEENERREPLLLPVLRDHGLGHGPGGARTETAAEMGTMLRLPDEARRVGDNAEQLPWETSLLHRGLAELSRRFNAEDKKYELAVANAMWGEKSYPFRDEFIETIDKFYGSGGLRMVDFKGNPNGERQRINRWVEEQTNQRIKDLLPGRFDRQP